MQAAGNLIPLAGRGKISMEMLHGHVIFGGVSLILPLARGFLSFLEKTEWIPRCEQPETASELRAPSRVNRGNIAGREEPKVDYLEVPSGFSNPHKGVCEPADYPGVLSLNPGPPRGQCHTTGSGKAKNGNQTRCKRFLMIDFGPCQVDSVLRECCMFLLALCPMAGSKVKSHRFRAEIPDQIPLNFRQFIIKKEPKPFMHSHRVFGF